MPKSHPPTKQENRKCNACGKTSQGPGYCNCGGFKGKAVRTTKQVKKKESFSTGSMYSTGFIYGQRKLANYLLTLTLDNARDYQWVLTHLKEVSEGREIMDNDVIGFRSYK